MRLKLPKVPAYHEILLRSSKYITLNLFFKGLLGIFDMKYVDKLLASLRGINGLIAD